MLQVLPGGKLFAIEGKMPVMKGVLHQLDHQGNWQKSVILETGIPSLIDKLKPKEFTF